MNYVEHPSFCRDLKALGKRFRTLPDDVEIWKANVLEILPPKEWITQDVVPIARHCGATYGAYKARKFSCKSLKGKGSKSGIRIIFVCEPALKKITLIEIYYKGDKENEDIHRLTDFCQEEM